MTVLQSVLEQIDDLRDAEFYEATCERTHWFLGMGQFEGTSDFPPENRERLDRVTRLSRPTDEVFVALAEAAKHWRDHEDLEDNVNECAWCRSIAIMIKSRFEANEEQVLAMLRTILSDPQSAAAGIVITPWVSLDLVGRFEPLILRAAEQYESWPDVFQEQFRDFCLTQLSQESRDAFVRTHLT